MVIETNSAKETFDAGYKLAQSVQPGQIYCLNGDLGVGKTVFTQGFAKGLGIEEPINSPTFTIVQEYHEGRLPLYHFDVYRIADVSEMDEIGYEEYFFSDGVCLIEWGTLIEELLPDSTITITIEKDLQKGFDYRKITISNINQKVENMELIIGFVILFWIGVKLNRWINGSSKIANNQRKIIEELRKQNQAKK